MGLVIFNLQVVKECFQQTFYHPMLCRGFEPHHQMLTKKTFQIGTNETLLNSNAIDCMLIHKWDHVFHYILKLRKELLKH